MITRSDDGRIEFRLYAPHARCAEVVGSFTGWYEHAVQMRRAPGGWWIASAHVEPGDHEFCYTLDRRRQVADYAAGGVRQSRFSQWVSLLHVPEAIDSLALAA